jgi:hypothetical protein
MEKTCFKCGETKPLDSFYKHPMMADGRLGKCAECTRADVRANRAARVEYYQAYDRNRNRDPQRIFERKERERDKSAPPRPEASPIKRAARTALGNAVRDGRLKKPPECEICAVSDDRLHGHHEDYTRPLDVIWVCAACHAFIHKYWRAQERVVA